jgi:uncharacterized membrane protein
VGREELVSTTKFTLGTSVRHWVTFEVKDATDEERTLLARGDEGEAIALARKLDADDRLIYEEQNVDDNPDYFDEDSDPSILDVTVTT